MAGETRTKMIHGAVLLLAERGLHDTSFSQVLETTGSPRGSIYHHFPGGKDELIASAIDLAGGHAVAVMEQAEGSSARDVTDHFVGLWRSLLSRSELRMGCSVLAVTVATDSKELLGHVAAVFRTWRIRLSELLATGGLRGPDADQFAVTLIAAMEGAVVLSRAEQTMAPFELVAAQLSEDVAALMAKSGNRQPAAE